MKVSFKNAEINDANTLTKISFDAKSTWNYPKEYMEKWKNELTITSQYIENNYVRCAVFNEMVIGFYSIVKLNEELNFGNIKMEPGYWLDHMFIEQKHQKMNVGRNMFYDIKKNIELGSLIRIFVDPNAKEFYEKMGAEFVRMSDSSIPNRQIPIFEYKITNENR